MNSMSGKIVSPIKQFGGKAYLAKRIIDVMQSRPIFVEGFCATAITSLYLSNQNFQKHFCFDTNRYIINFWQVLQCRGLELQKFLRNVEYSEENFERAKEHMRQHEDEPGESLFDASMYFIVNRMSRSADHKTFGWSDRLRRGMPEYVSAYSSAVDNLLNISFLIQDITFRCGDYMQLMLDYELNESADVVQYLDPPYQHQARTACRPYGKYEMKTFCRDAAEGELTHECLASFLTRGVVGLTYLSGYASSEYKKWYQGYPNYMWEVANSASQAKAKRKMQEILYVIDNSEG